MKQYVKKNFFKENRFCFLEHTQDFEVAVSGATSVKELKRPLAKSLKKLNLKLRVFKRILDLTEAKGEGLKVLSNLILRNNVSISAILVIHMASNSAKCD